MKADPADQKRLLELQAHDTRLTQLAHRARALPVLATIAELTKGLDVLQGVATERRGALEDAQAELTRLEQDVAVVEARSSRDQERLLTASSPKDVAALEQEIAALRTRRLDLEEIELTVMERVEAAENELAETTGTLEELQGQLAGAEAERVEAMAEVDAERTSTEEARAALARLVPQELLDLYERQRSRYGFGASLLRFGVSSATGVSLTADELARIRSAAPDDVLLCPSSDAILVRTDESGI